MNAHDVVALELVQCSSEETLFRARNLVSDESATALHHLLHPDPSGGVALAVGWQSEKFCEYPQEIVLRVAGSRPARIASIVVVSHPSLIASRIEIFVSSSRSKDWTSVKFQRLGYVALRHPQETQCIAQELKTIPLQHVASKEISYIKLLVHRCHLDAGNLCNQVGLACVVAITDHSDGFTGASSHSEVIKNRLSDQQDPEEYGISWWLPQVKSTGQLSPPRLKKPFASVLHLPPQATHALWIEDKGEYTTPEQILTRIQLAREAHAQFLPSVLRSDELLARFKEEQQLMLADELQCQAQRGKLLRLQREEESARSADRRSACRREAEDVTRSLVEMERQARRHEQIVKHRSTEANLARSPIKKAKVPPASDAIFPLKDQWSTWELWQVREEFVWKVVSSIKQYEPPPLTDVHEEVDRMSGSPALSEALEIARKGIEDSHPQVFVAASELLKLVLTRDGRFHSGSAWKHDVIQLLQSLAKRLDDVESVIRNNAAFVILKIAEYTQARGSFVLHHLLLLYEKRDRDEISDQTLHSVLKITTALLLSFHCCASLDISYKRLLKFAVVAHDSLVHASGHVCEAARQLLVVLHAQVGGDEIVAYLTTKQQPAETVDAVGALFSLLPPHRVVHGSATE